MRIVLLLIFLSSIVGFSQEKSQFINKGLLLGKGTLAVGSKGVYTSYVSGNLEYYLQKNISFRGGIWLFLDGASFGEFELRKNHTLFTGFYYHVPTKGHLDPYIGFEPGVSWTQLKDNENIRYFSAPTPPFSSFPQKLSPVASSTLGINYFASNWVHLFAEIKYVYGIHTSDLPAYSLNEMRVAFGFGFNVWAIKKVK